jgi:16S rRNA (cytosine1402-N4)-methyltransferase
LFLRLKREAGQLQALPMNDNIHLPVLAEQVLAYLNPQSGESYLDLTAGYGGHAALMLDRIGPNGKAVLVDRDQNAVDHLQDRFDGDKRVQIMHSDFASASKQLLEQGHAFDCILADIGVSSPHLDNPDRGFSFMYEGPLDMRMDPRQMITAATVVNESSEEDLAAILFRFGEVKSSRRLAARIVSARPLATTKELAAIIKDSIKGPRQSRVLAQVFQALRITVNDELGMLQTSLPLWIGLLKPKGRLGIISFHSLEDRIVKQYFAEHGGNRFDSEFTVLTKQPVSGTDKEIVFNPRARSAKLRVSQRK